MPEVRWNGKGKPLENATRMDPLRGYEVVYATVFFLEWNLRFLSSRFTVGSAFCSPREMLPSA